MLIQAIINECANHLPTSIETRKFCLPLNRKYLRAKQLCEETGEVGRGHEEFKRLREL